jgi:hypothetical protein
MSRSLKALTPGLARILGTTSHKLYEREQALMRGGLLASKAGRGPGSGVTATAPSIALLLIAALATDALGQTEIRTREVAEATPVGIERCPLTGMTRFMDALANLLASRARSSRVIEITVSRTAASAAIVFRIRGARERRTVEFAGSNSKEPPLRVAATLDGTAIKQIVADVVEILLAPDEPDPPGGTRQGGTPEKRSVRRSRK